MWKGFDVIAGAEEFTQKEPDPIDRKSVLMKMESIKKFPVGGTAAIDEKLVYGYCEEVQNNIPEIKFLVLEYLDSLMDIMLLVFHN